MIKFLCCADTHDTSVKKVMKFIFRVQFRVLYHLVMLAVKKEAENVYGIFD